MTDEKRTMMELLDMSEKMCTDTYTGQKAYVCPISGCQWRFVETNPRQPALRVVMRNHILDFHPGSIEFQKKLEVTH